MMIRKSASAALAVAFAVMTAAAQPGMGPQGEGPGCEIGGKGGKGKMIAELGLTEEQQVKLKVLRLDHQKELVQFMPQMKKMREAIRDELKKPAASRGALKKYAAELADLHEQMENLKLDHLLKVKDVLTAEQFSKLVDREQERGSMGDCGRCPDREACMKKGHGKTDCPMGRQGPAGKPGKPCPHAGEPPQE